MILSSELKGRIMSLGVEEVEDSEDMVNAYVQLAQYGMDFVLAKLIFISCQMISACPFLQ
jgi:hypothetical protein